MSEARQRAKVACACGFAGEVTIYDIGSGSEWCCPSCDWCYGYFGQQLKTYEPPWPTSGGVRADPELEAALAAALDAPDEPER